MFPFHVLIRYHDENLRSLPRPWVCDRFVPNLNQFTYYISKDTRQGAKGALVSLDAKFSENGGLKNKSSRPAAEKEI